MASLTRPVLRRPRRDRESRRRSSSSIVGALALCAALALPASASAATNADGLWYFDRGRVQEAIDAGFDGSGVTIAVIDTQVNPDAPGLRGADLRVAEDSYCYDDDAQPYSPVSTDYIAASHGTNVVSMILGTGEAVGGTPIKGVAPGATVRYYNSMITTGTGDSTDVESTCLQENGEMFDASSGWEDPHWSGLGKAISDAVDDGADIISVSLGGLVDAADAVAKAHAAGVVVLGSLPNVGGVGDWPASYNGVVAVQAFGPDGQIQKSAYFEEISEPTPNLSDDVIISGPGLEIVMQGTAASWDDQQVRSGTSFATPIVAGFLAVVKQKYPEATGNQLLQSLLHNTGTKGEHEPEWNNATGYGAASLTGMLAVDPTKYPDVNPLFDAETEDAVPNQQNVDDQRALLDATPTPTAESEAGDSAASALMPFIIGGGVVLFVLVVGGVVLAIVVSRGARRKQS